MDQKSQGKLGNVLRQMKLKHHISKLKLRWKSIAANPLLKVDRSPINLTLCFRELQNDIAKSRASGMSKYWSRDKYTRNQKTK